MRFRRRLHHLAPALRRPLLNDIFATSQCCGAGGLTQQVPQRVCRIVDHVLLPDDD